MAEVMVENNADVATVHSESAETMESRAADGIQKAPAEAQETRTPATMGCRGLKTFALILGNEMVEKGTSAGVQALLTFYLKRQYFISNTAVATILILWNALSNFTSPCASLAADLDGRFRVISASSILAFLGMGIMWATTLSSKARPPPCYESNDPCEGPNGGQLLLLFTSLFLMGIGGGGIRRCSQTFAADQIMINRPAGAPTISISWYQTGAGIWVIIVVLLLTIAQEEYGWGFGFGAAAVFMLLSLVVFFMASAGYSKLPGGTDGAHAVVKSLSRVIVAAWRKRSQSTCPPLWFYEGAVLACPTNQLSFLNKACLVVNEEKEVNPTTGLPTDPWALCSVEQVEEFKALVKLIPIWSTGVLIAALTSPLTFTSLQAETMKRQFIGRRIQIPESAYGVFTVASSTLLAALYNLSNKFFVSNAGIPATWRMGIGAALSCTANIVAGAVERSRREKEIFTMSANCLIVQLCLTGLGDGFSVVAHSEFYDSHFVGVGGGTMKGIGKGLWSLSQFAGGLVASLVLLMVKKLTGKGVRNWVADDLDRSHYDFYYWLLATLGLINFLYYLMICMYREKHRIHCEKLLPLWCSRVGAS